MPKSVSSRRSVRLLTAMLCLWGVISARLVQIQTRYGPTFADRGEQQRTFRESIPAHPGEIYDREGRLLAKSVVTQSVFIDPSRIGAPWDTARALAGALHMNPDGLFERLARHRRKRFLWVKRRIPEDELQRIRTLTIGRDAIGLRPEFRRVYPMGTLAAHLLGLRDLDGRGQGGIEEQFDTLLRGRPGERRFTRDARGRLLEVQPEAHTPPQEGASIRLTIDAVIQYETERHLDALMEEFAPASACAIVLDPRTSQLLAMASRPTFDPNNPGGTPPAAWKNTAISAEYEPGSTFKPFLVAWALDQEAVARNEHFHCEHGSYRMGRRILHDHHSYGDLSLTDVLVKSSNIGMAKVGERLGNARLYEAVTNFGFGRRTGLTLPGELTGTVHPLDQWTGYSTGSIPMGQELTVTPIQMATAHAALANGGRWQSPRLVLELMKRDESITGRESWKSEPHLETSSVVTPVVTPGTARWLIEQPMRLVVEQGTGRKAQLDDYTVFGKTGTAQKLDPQTGKFSHTRHVASFVCGAPVHDPAVLVLVMADEPSRGSSHYGGTVAAPTAARILHGTLRLLEVPPDRLARTPATFE